MSDTFSVIGRRLRVLHIQKVSGIAGSERHLLTLLPALHERGIDVEMLTLTAQQPGADDFLEQMTSAEIPSFAMSIRRHFDPALVSRLARFIKTRAYDIVHTHLIHADLHGGLAARVAGRVRLVSTRHNDDEFRLSEPIQSIVRLNSRMFDRIICVSDHIRHFCSAAERIDPLRLVTIPYGSKPDAIRNYANVKPVGLPERRGPVIGLVAALTQQPGYDTLFQAMLRVSAAMPNLQLLIVGDGPKRTELEQRTRTLGLADVVHFLGARNDASALMLHFDLLIHPLRREGFGLVILDAMTAGRPVVATRANAVDEIVVDGETGLLVDPENSDALAEAVLRILNEPGLAARMGATARTHVEREFSVGAMADCTCDLYSAILDEPRRRESA